LWLQNFHGEDLEKAVFDLGDKELFECLVAFGLNTGPVVGK